LPWECVLGLEQQSTNCLSRYMFVRKDTASCQARSAIAVQSVRPSAAQAASDAADHLCALRHAQAAVTTGLRSMITVR
jgi:DNA-binding LacI/PurR family transcriptional regulator